MTNSQPWKLKKTNKFYNEKVIVNGIKFDSKLEARHYKELLLLERGGIIKELVLQPCFELQPKFEKNGEKFQAITYRADFQYTLVKTGATIIEDVKGLETETFKLKKKLFEYKFPQYKLQEIRSNQIR